MTVNQLGIEFSNPKSSHRALSMDTGLASASEPVQELTSSRWGGLLCSYPHERQQYLRDEIGWSEFQKLVDVCKAGGLDVWIYDERGYPSGRAGGLVLDGYPELEAQGLFYDSIDVVVDTEPRTVEWRVPDGRLFFAGLYQLDLEGETVGDPIDITGSVAHGLLQIELKPGSWRLVAFAQNRLREGTHAVLTGGPYINVLDPEAVRRFLEVTYDAYYANCASDFGRTIKAVFNDEASLMSGYLTNEVQPYPAIAWYHDLPRIFRERHGYDIRRCLPALFNNVGPDTARMRCDFYLTLARQIAEAFFRQIRDWCAEHGVASTGHLVWEESLIYHASFYGSVFPALKELDWPGIDVLGCSYGHASGSHTSGGPVTPKLASSVSRLYGKQRTMSESFCFVTSETPIEDLLAHVNWQWVLGVNALAALSIGCEYPHDSLALFNDYVGRLSAALTKGQAIADVAVLYPIASVLAEFRPTNRHVHYLADNPKASDVDEAWRRISSEILGCQRDFDYLDEEAVQKAEALDGSLVFGENRYSVLILPHVTALEYGTLKQIERFVDSGGTVISYQTVPLIRVDEGPVAEQVALVDKLWQRKDRIIHTETISSFRRALRRAGTPDVEISPATSDVYYQHRALADGDVYFLVNNSTKPVVGQFAFRSTGETEMWDPLTGDVSPVYMRDANGAKTAELTLGPRRGLFLVFSRGV